MYQLVRNCVHNLEAIRFSVYVFQMKLISVLFVLLLLLICCVSQTQSEKIKKNKINAMPLKSPPGKNKSMWRHRKTLQLRAK